MHRAYATAVSGKSNFCVHGSYIIIKTLYYCSDLLIKDDDGSQLLNQEHEIYINGNYAVFGNKLNQNDRVFVSVMISQSINLHLYTPAYYTQHMYSICMVFLWCVVCHLHCLTTFLITSNIHVVLS